MLNENEMQEINEIETLDREAIGDKAIFLFKKYTHGFPEFNTVDVIDFLTETCQIAYED